MRSVLKEIPDDPILLNKIAIIYYRSGQIKNYDELVKQLNRLPEGANDLNQYMMESSQREGRWEDFIFYANEYLKNDPGDLNVRIALAEAYYLKNNFKVAKEHLNLAKQRMPTYPKINYYEARISLVEGKKEEYSTVGWTLIDHDAINMPRPIAEQRLNRYIELGHNPQYIRVVVDNG